MHLNYSLHPAFNACSPTDLWLVWLRSRLLLLITAAADAAAGAALLLWRGAWSANPVNRLVANSIGREWAGTRLKISCVERLIPADVLVCATEMLRNPHLHFAKITRFPTRH